MAAPKFDASADETLTLVTAGHTRLHMIQGVNGDAAVRYLQLFDSATTGAVTLGTTTPTAVLAIPSSGDGPFAVDCKGLVFYAGLVYAVTTTSTGSTGPTAAATLTLGYE